MSGIDEIIWYEKGRVSVFDSKDGGRAFKWLLAEKEDRLILMAMPNGTNLDFHNELREAVCGLRNWNVEDLNVLGGGVRVRSGEILHRSEYFGEMPKEYREIVLRLLKLN